MKYILCFLGLFFGVTLEGYALPSHVIIIRHAEKPPEGNSLNEKGKKRAEALPMLFVSSSLARAYGTPIAIYAARPFEKAKSLRPIETVTPLANTLDLPILAPYTRDEVQKLAQEIMSNPKYDNKMVLISWVHRMIPKLAKAFGAENSPTKWPHKAFDRMWVLTFNKDGTVTYQDLPQKLLLGDSEE